MTDWASATTYFRWQANVVQYVYVWFLHQEELALCQPRSPRSCFRWPVLRIVTHQLVDRQPLLAILVIGMLCAPSTIPSQTTVEPFRIPALGTDNYPLWIANLLTVTKKLWGEVASPVLLLLWGDGFKKMFNIPSWTVRRIANNWSKIFYSCKASKNSFFDLCIRAN